MQQYIGTKLIEAAPALRYSDGKTVLVVEMGRDKSPEEEAFIKSAENYDEDLGAGICMEHINDQVWKLLGFLLQTAVHGIN